MNKPYIKKYSPEGALLNPIKKDSPYLHKGVSERRKKDALKYKHLYHPITGDHMGKVKVGGNNRKWQKDKSGNKRPRTFKIA